LGIQNQFSIALRKGGALKTCPLPKDGKFIYGNTTKTTICFACLMFFGFLGCFTNVIVAIKDEEMGVNLL
jgi:hypothetical protein